MRGMGGIENRQCRRGHSTTLGLIVVFVAASLAPTRVRTGQSRCDGPPSKRHKRIARNLISKNVSMVLHHRAHGNYRHITKAASRHCIIHNRYRVWSADTSLVLGEVALESRRRVSISRSCVRPFGCGGCIRSHSQDALALGTPADFVALRARVFREEF